MIRLQHTRPTRITVKDIAEALELSHSTVSRALANDPRVNAATKVRVEEIARRLGYIANSAAKIMRGSPSSLVGCVIPDIENDFYSTVAKAIADCLYYAGYQMILAVTEDNPDREYEETRALSEARVSGIIIVPTAMPRRETVKLLKCVSTVQLVRKVDHIVSDVFVVDDHVAIHQSTRHLIELGHRSIAYVGGDTEMSTGAVRLKGFLDAIAESGLRLSNVRTELGIPRPEHGKAAIQRLAQLGAKGPTALVAGSSQITLGVVQGAQELGLRIPENFSLVGFGDPPWCSLFGTGITTVRLPTREIAHAAAERMLRSIREESSPPDGDLPLAYSAYRPELVVRGSTQNLSTPRKPRPPVRADPAPSGGSRKSKHSC